MIEVLLTAEPHTHTPTQPHSHTRLRIDERFRCRPEDLRPAYKPPPPPNPQSEIRNPKSMTPEEQRAFLRSSPAFENLVQAIKSSVIQDRLDARAAAGAAGLPEPPMEFPWDKKERPPAPKEEPEIADAPVGVAALLTLVPNPQSASPSGSDIPPAAPDPASSPSSFAVRPSHWIGSRPEDEATEEAIAAYEEQQEWERKMEADYI